MDYSKPKQAYTKSYVIPFGATGKASVQIDVPFNVSAIKVYYPNYTRHAGATDTEWVIYSTMLPHNDDVLIGYSPSFNSVITSDENPRFHYYPSSKKLDNTYEFTQASSSNSFAYDGTIPNGVSAGNNTISLTMTFYEH